MRAYITNLPYTLDKDDLAEWLVDKGITTAADVFLPRDRDESGLNRGFAFASCEESEDALLLGLSGQHFQGRKLTIVLARPDARISSRISACGHHEQ